MIGDMKYVIRAGGVGSRLWPVSRENNPKQFHALTSSKTMLQEAVDRVLPISRIEDIYVSTQASSVEMVKQQCPELPAQNLIIEPERKDTAAAIGLESIMIRKKDPEAIVASLGSDHSVRRVKEFQVLMKIAQQCVEKHPEMILPIGVRPTHPDTGYGYIQYGDVIDTIDGKNIWKVTRFTEKPDEKQAKEFLRQNQFLWNANMFVWKVSTILALYEKYLPEMYKQLLVIEAALGTPQEQETIQRVYPQLEKIAVDYAIIEKADQIAAMAADIGWSDIGDWARLKDELSDTEADNVVIGANHVGIKTANTLVYSDNAKKVITTIGVKNLVIVDTGDALLICDKYHSSEVKDVVQLLKDQHKEEAL